MFAKGPGNWSSIPGPIIPKIQKIVIDASLLNTQHYKVRRKVKWSNPLHLSVLAIEKEPSGHTQLTWPTFYVFRDRSISRRGRTLTWTVVLWLVVSWHVVYCVILCVIWNSHRRTYHLLIKVKLATLVVGHPKAPFSIATTSRVRCYYIPWIAPLYHRSLPYNAEC